MMVIEPVSTVDWSALVSAASRGCRPPDIGRKLPALLRHAGFSAIDVQLVTRPDTEGRLLPMIRTIADNARGGGEISEAGSIRYCSASSRRGRTETISSSRRSLS